jgi:transitional endoplasmic reticulum ATPase
VYDLKKSIIAAAGNTITIETDGSQHDFKAGDIISHDPAVFPGSLWTNKQVSIEGFSNNEIWAIVKGKPRAHQVTNPQGVILLERPGWKFKVGDKVQSTICARGKTGEIIILDPQGRGSSANPLVLVEFANWEGGHNGIEWDKNWYPAKYKTESRSRYWIMESDLTLLESAVIPQSKSEPEQIVEAEIKTPKINENKEVLEVKEDMPQWLKDMILQIKGELSHMFIIWGNIYDLQRTSKGYHHYITLNQYLNDSFEQRELIMFYSISAGLQFATKEMEKLFRDQYLKGQAAKPAPEQMSASDKAAQGMNQTMSEKAPIADLIGKSPEKVFPLLERVLFENGPANAKRLLIMDFAHNLAPNQPTNGNLGDRINTETLERWARDKRIKDSGNIIILLTPNLGDLAESIRSPQSGISILRIPKPGDADRQNRWEFRLASDGLKIEDGIDAAIFGRITSGLSIRQIDEIAITAKVGAVPLSLGLIKSKKQTLLQNEFGDRITIKTPKWGFDYFGGKEKIKNFLSEINNNIKKDILRRVPMGILASGPPGTGKTFLFECWAYESGINFVEITNPRSMWHGQSEEILDRIFAIIDDVSPVIVVEDEADQSESSRDSFDGTSGVSGRLRQKKFQFTSDPKRRGRVIWVRISNRDDLIDAAYKRKGRTDECIPFGLPNELECKSIFDVMFKRYEIPTDIGDYSPFARKVIEKTYCTGGDIEWMVRESDILAGHENIDKVEPAYLYNSIDEWELKNDPHEIDRQLILSIKGSSKRLRDDDWEEQLKAAEKRLGNGNGNGFMPSVHSDFPRADKELEKVAS